MSESRLHAVAASSDAPDYQSGEGGPQPTLLLQLPQLDFTNAVWVIKPVSLHTASKWLAEHHYLGDVSTAGISWGVFCPDLAAIVTVGYPNNVYGVAGRLGLDAYSGNMEITRVAVHPEFRVERSRVIRRVLTVAAPKLDWVFSYADPKVGHHGGIYQALGAVYVGLSPAYDGWVKNGVLLHPRQAVAQFGSQNGSDMAVRGYTKVKAAFGGLHTYVLPLRNKQAIVAALAPLTRPYPKRAVAA